MGGFTGGIRTEMGWEIVCIVRDMSCPRVVKRNRGSGYEKCETPSAPVVALNNDIAARLAERAAQDAKLFPPLQAPVVEKPSVILNKSSH